jgi:hypothetical protein
MDTFKVAITALLIAAFAAFVAFLLHEVGVSTASWERYVYLLSGVEAVVFAAVGWLFGKEVHREQAEKAEAGAQAAAARTREAQAGHLTAAQEAASEKAKGLALARAVVAHAASPTDRLAALNIDSPVHAAALAPLAELAQSSYPEATSLSGS